MYNNTKTFFSKARADKFAKQVNGDIWAGKDAFEQTVYIVKWN